MKRQLYDLTDEPFVVFVNKIGETLREQEVPYNIVGGVAAQAYILDMLAGKYGENVSEISGDENIRVQDFVRSTDDVDIALDLKGVKGDDSEKMKWITREFLPHLKFEEVSPDGESILRYTSERIGASRPRFRVYVNEQGGEDDVIAMNISRGQKGDLHDLHDKWYSKFIERGRDLEVPYSEGYKLRIRVPRLEHVLATKIARSRAKDLMDNKNIATLAKDVDQNLDFKEIRGILLPSHLDNFQRFLASEYPDMVR